MTERRTVVLQRTYPAPVTEVWTMWTTKDGIESWWGPDGFEVEVHSLDLSPGGEMWYSMKAIAAEAQQELANADMPLVTRHAIVFVEVDPHRRLAYTNVVDFIPGVEKYEAGTVLDLTPTDAGTELTLTLDVMHDPQWTNLAVAGWEQELEKLRSALDTRKEMR